MSSSVVPALDRAAIGALIQRATRDGVPPPEVIRTVVRHAGAELVGREQPDGEIVFDLGDGMVIEVSRGWCPPGTRVVRYRPPSQLKAKRKQQRQARRQALQKARS